MRSAEMMVRPSRSRESEDQVVEARVLESVGDGGHREAARRERDRPNVPEPVVGGDEDDAVAPALGRDPIPVVEVEAGAYLLGARAEEPHEVDEVGAVVGEGAPREASGRRGIAIGDPEHVGAAPPTPAPPHVVGEHSAGTGERVGDRTRQRPRESRDQPHRGVGDHGGIPTPRRRVRPEPRPPSPPRRPPR